MYILAGEKSVGQSINVELLYDSPADFSLAIKQFNFCGRVGSIEMTEKISEMDCQDKL